MRDFDKFIGQIKDAGIIVNGESVVRASLASHTNWTACAASLAITGRMLGVQFHRRVAGEPTNDRLHSILLGYPFNFDERAAFIRNVVNLGTSDAAADAQAAPPDAVDSRTFAQLEAALTRLRAATEDNDIGEIAAAMHFYACWLSHAHGTLEVGRLFAKVAGTALVDLDEQTLRDVMLDPHGRGALALKNAAAN